MSSLPRKSPESSLQALPVFCRSGWRIQKVWVRQMEGGLGYQRSHRGPVLLTENTRRWSGCLGGSKLRRWRFNIIFGLIDWSVLTLWTKTTNRVMSVKCLSSLVLELLPYLRFSHLKFGKKSNTSKTSYLIEMFVVFCFVFLSQICVIVIWNENEMVWK